MAIEIDLLRRIRWQRPDHPEGQPLSRKDAALLAVLALDGTVARDTLALMLWPAVDAVRARASLRQRRFRLTRATGLALIEGEETLRLAAAVRHSAGDLDRRLDDDPGALDGEWLGGLVFPDCPEFEHWLTQARERWQVLRGQALARAASRLEAGQRLAPALAIAKRLVADEPLSDHAHRRLMRLHHLRGDLGAALEVYRRFAERLDAELGELPDDETARLAAQLRQGQLLPRAPAPLPASLQRPPRLVGRDAAWHVLQGAWDAGGSVLVEGAPGMGKTRLLDDFLRGRPACLRLAARPGDADRPYALFTRLLAELWFGPEACWPAGPAMLPAWARRELAALLPELGESAPRLDPLRLARAAELALRPPVGAPALQLVALDDVQQADHASLELLPTLASRQREGDGPRTEAGPPVSCPGWWLAVRRGELPPPLTAWLASSEAPRRVALAPLDAKALRTLLDDMAADAPAIDLPRLQRYTGGIPLFVLETLRSLHELRAVPGDAGAQWAVAPAGDASDVLLGDATLPARAAALVQGRLQRLPEAAQQLAAAVALWPGAVSLAEGAGLLGGEPALWAEPFQLLEAAHWLDAEGRMHDLVRQAVLAQQPVPVRRWLHARVAAQLGALQAPPQDQARHWQQAGSPGRAAPLWQQAALAVRRSARPLEESALWDQAIAAYEAAGQPQPAFAAWRESIESRLFSAGPRATLPQVTAMLARAGDEAQRLDALIALAEVQTLLADAMQVRPLAEEAARLARQRGDAGCEVRAGLQLASVLAQGGGCDEALVILDRLQPLLASAPAQRYAWVSTRSFVLHRAGRFSACAEMLEQASEMSQARHDLMEVCTTRSNIASLLVSLGRMEAALAMVESALAVREQLGPATGVHHANVDLHHGYALVALGRLGSGVAAMERARDAFAAHDPVGTWQTVAGNALAAAELVRGATAAAQARLVPPGPQTPPFVAARHHVIAARIARALGQDPDPALAAADAVLGPHGDRLQRACAQAERLVGLPRARASEAAHALAALQAELDATEQHAQAARLGWLAVDRWLQAGQASEAAQAARALLGADAPRPLDLLPSAVWMLAAQALQAAGDFDSATDARRHGQAALWREREDLDRAAGSPADPAAGGR